LLPGRRIRQRSGRRSHGDGGSDGGDGVDVTLVGFLGDFGTLTGIDHSFAHRHPLDALVFLAARATSSLLIFGVRRYVTGRPRRSAAWTAAFFNCWLEAMANSLNCSKRLPLAWKK